MALRVRKQIKNGLVMMAVGVLAGTGTFIALKYHDIKHEPSVKEVLEEAKEKAEEAVEAPIDEMVTEVVTIRQETLEELFKPASELVTYKYYYTAAADMEKFKELFGYKIPGTTERTVFTYDGTVSAGIDLSKLSYDSIDNEKKTIVITLPAPEIFSHELDTGSFSYYDVTSSLFTAITPEELTDKLDELKLKETAKLYRDDDFFDSVSENAENVLRELLTMNSDTADFTVTFNTTAPDLPIEATPGTVVDGNIAMPSPASAYQSYTYSELTGILREMGFTNIADPEPVKDLYAGLLIKDGQVESFTINGMADFSAGQIFPADAPIVIRYHTFVEQTWTLPPVLQQGE